MRSCFAIPIHQEHFKFLDFLHTVSPEDFDIWLILSYKKDLESLRAIKLPIKYKALVLEDDLDKSCIKEMIDRSVIITAKKYFALQKLSRYYDYISTVDSEIFFVSNRVHDKFSSFCNERTVVSTDISGSNADTDFALRINRSSASFFTGHDLEALAKVTNNFHHYWWFSNPPIYGTSIVGEFFDYIKFTNAQCLSKIQDWYVFDYIPYIYYCVLHKGYRLINTKDFDIGIDWSLEKMSFDIYQDVRKKMNYQPLWIKHSVYQSNKEQFTRDGIIMTYHRDRG